MPRDETPVEGRPTKLRRLTAKGRRRRADILAAATRMLQAHGYENLSMRQLAKACAIELKNVQYYFPTREDVLVGVIEESFEQIIDAVERTALAQRNAGPKVPKLEESLFEILDLRAAAIWLQFFAMAPNSTKFMRLKEAIYERHHAALATLLQWEYPKAEATHRTARLLTALIDGAALARTPSRRRRLSFRTLERDVQRVSKVIIDTELGGSMRHSPTPQRRT